MTLLELNRAVCAQVKAASLASGIGAELVAEDVSRPIIRPSIKVELEDGTDAALSMRASEQKVTFRIYFFARDRHRPKLDNLAMREALSDLFRSGLDTAEGTVPIDDGISFTVADGVLTATLDLLLEQETPESEELMDTLNTSWEES